MNVAKALLAAGADSAEAIRCRSQSVKYAELRARVLGVANSLLARAHRKGDRIGIFSENIPFFVYSYLGIIRAGLTAVPLQTETSADLLRQIVRDSGVRTILVSDRLFPRLRPLAEPLGVGLFSESDSLTEEITPAFRPAEIDPSQDLAALMFTSGSTGAPKGVMISHRNIEQNTLDIVSYMGLNHSDRVMVILPLHYCFGLSLLHSHLMVGGSIVLNNEFKLFPETMLDELQREHCTGLAGVPSTYQLLLRRSSFTKRGFPGLQWLQQAGGKLPNPLIEEIMQAFPEVKLIVMYGQTEATARLSYLPPEMLSRKLGSIGRGLPHAQLQVIGADGSPVVPGSGQIGEIVARGESVALGYWNDPTETARAFRDGALHTGDLARVDADGYIFIVGREGDMIKRGGNRISAKEVEEVIAELPSIVEVAVIGVPDIWLGEAIAAVVVPAPNAAVTPRDIEIHCHRRLPRFKVPEEIHFFDRMPQSASGKVLRQALRKLLQSESSGASRDRAFSCEDQIPVQ